MISTQYLVAITAVIAFVTMALRFIPFLVLGGKETPAYIEFLGKFLPYSIMGMLVVYCLKDVSFSQLSYAVPQIVSAAAVVLIHIWKRNTLLSIVCSTAFYMLLIRLQVF